MDTTGEKEKTSKKNVDKRSTSSHDNKKFGTRSMEKHRGMAFGFRKTATAVIKPDRLVENISYPSGIRTRAHPAVSLAGVRVCFDVVDAFLRRNTSSTLPISPKEDVQLVSSTTLHRVTGTSA
jgi:hypothetical protein